MSFDRCIDDGVAEGEISQEKANEIKANRKELFEQYEFQMSPAAASAKADIDTVIAMKKASKEKKRRAMLQAKTWTRLRMHLDTAVTVGGRQDKYKASLDILAESNTSKLVSVAQLHKVINNAATAKMTDFLTTFKRNIVGETRNKAQLKNVVKEVFGKDTGDINAKQMAQAWAEAAEYLRKRFNAAGGAIPKRKDWGLPQFHNSLSVKLAGFNNWRDFIAPRLDLEKMLDEQTGLPFSKQKIELVLKDSWETIQSNGQNKNKPGTIVGSQTFASRNQDHRFFVFKDPDSWMQYQEKFGNPNPFDAMMGHLDNMSRDIAMMEVMGPDPKTTLKFIQDTLTKEASISKDPKEINRASKANNSLNDLYSATIGTNNAPIDGALATTFAGVRQLLHSAQLGGASILALTGDANFGRIARTMNGLPQKKMISNYLTLMNPLGLEEKAKLAMRIGLTAEGYTTMAAAQMRYVGEMSGPEITRRTADFVMRASLLSPWTNAGKWAFGMEYLGFIADNASLKFNELPANMQKTMDHYNIGSDKWDIIRATPLYDYEGSKFLRAEDIENRTDINPELARDLATSLSVLIDTETNYAVPSSSLRGRVALTGDTRPGTLAGELTRSFAMYKNFGVTLINTHIMRSLAKPTTGGKAMALSDLIITTTLMGALGLQLKEMAKGRDPREMDPMESPEFWGAALLAGGGLSLFGDFLSSSTNRYGDGLAGTVAGPVVGLAGDVGELTFGNIIEAMSGNDTNIASEAVSFAGRYTPGSTIWYIRLAIERGITDQAKLWVDPDARSKMKRLESRYRRENGQNHWWRPGKMTPDRAPDLSKMFE